MSRYYHMSVTLKGVAPARVEAVKEAADVEWDFEIDDWRGEPPGPLETHAHGSLCAGETEEEFAERLAKVIWAANGGYCSVEVIATYLEDVPCETHSFDEDDYSRLTTSAPDPPTTQEETPNG
jgi:hypothetical protein